MCSIFCLLDLICAQFKCSSASEVKSVKLTQISARFMSSREFIFAENGKNKNLANKKALTVTEYITFCNFTGLINGAFSIKFYQVLLIFYRFVGPLAKKVMKRHKHPTESKYSSATC